MSTVAPKAPPSRTLPRKPVKRLASLKNGEPPRLSSTTTPLPRPTSKTLTCPNPSCTDPNVIDDDGHRVCINCGYVINDSNIVSDLQFSETATGAATVQGAFVAADRTHARSDGPGFHRGDGSSNRERTEMLGRHEIARLGGRVRIEPNVQESASRIFKLAVGFNFIQGRRLNAVAAVCLYIACRRNNEGTKVMLIDLSDIIRVNVFSLGRVYSALLEELRCNYGPYHVLPINPENLIYRFAEQLELGSKRTAVAKEAVRIVQRMNRDWMTPGRRPSGICGAALIIAARMNNFRRTVREMVYIVKVTELTLTKRLEEFTATPSGNLTVEEFRTVDLEKEHDPPAFYLEKQGKKPSKRGRKRKAAEAVEEEQAESTHAGAQTPPPNNRGPTQYDKDGFAIPYPVDPALRRSPIREDAIDPSLTNAVNTALTEMEGQLQASADEPTPIVSPKGDRLSASAQLPTPESSQRPDSSSAPLTTSTEASEQASPSNTASQAEPDPSATSSNAMPLGPRPPRPAQSEHVDTRPPRPAQSEHVDTRPPRPAQSEHVDTRPPRPAQSEHAHARPSRAARSEHTDTTARGPPQPAQSEDADTASNDAELPPRFQSNRPPGRPPGRRNNPLPVPTEADLALEATLESEITSALDSADLKEAAMMSQIPNGAPIGPKAHMQSQHLKESPAPSQEQKSAQSSQETQQIPPTRNGRVEIPDDEIIGGGELEDDPEVKYCELTEAEKEVKEAMWVHENRDWLLRQQQKMLKAQNAEKLGLPGSTSNPTKRRKRHRGRIGDISYLENGEDGDGKGSRPTTPAEATRAMLGKRGYSSKINYDIIKGLYGDEDAGSQASTDSIRSSSRARALRRSSVSSSYSTNTSRTSTPVPVSPSPPPTQAQSSSMATAPKPTAHASNIATNKTGTDGVEILGPVRTSSSRSSTSSSPRPVELAVETADMDMDDDDEGDPEDYVDEEDDAEDHVEDALGGRYEMDEDE